MNAKGQEPPQQLTIAFLGKGGVGKSMIAGTVCRYLARDGQNVLALDVDTVPGLTFSLGISPGSGRLPSGLAAITEGKKGRYWKILKGAGAANLVDRYAACDVDGIRYLELGKLPNRVEPSVSVAFRHVMQHFRRPGWATVADLAGGTRQPMFGWAEFAATRVLVVEPSAKSMLAARRLASVATHVVANRIRSDDEVAAVMAWLPLPLIGIIPYDESVSDAERQGLAPIDVVPGSPAMDAIATLTCRLEEMR